MPAQEFGGGSGKQPGGPSAEEVIAQLQELVDAKPVGGRVSPEWAVKAYFLGDVNALAGLSLRAHT